MTHTVAFIGTGPNPENPDWGTSAAMAYRHGAGYAALDLCELAACADIVPENARAFADEFDIPQADVYEDYGEMLAAVEPDIVSVSTPVPTHADIVTDVAESGRVGAIHCEKPMADIWADCRRMVETCEAADVQLTFNHQRRFDPAWVTAEELLDEGTIGDLERIEMGGKNLLDYGTHLLDLCNHYNDEGQPAWVLAALDYREADVRYGTHNENQALALWEYENGVHGLASTGVGWPAIGAHHRLLGTAGTIEVKVDDGPDLRYRNETTDGWMTETPEADVDAIARAIEHIVECYESGETPVIRGRNALRSTELIFAAWESVRRRGRVELPLDIDDNPLEAMVESGELTPRSDDE